MRLVSGPALGTAGALLLVRLLRACVCSRGEARVSSTSVRAPMTGPRIGRTQSHDEPPRVGQVLAREDDDRRLGERAGEQRQPSARFRRGARRRSPLSQAGGRHPQAAVLLHHLTLDQHHGPADGQRQPDLRSPSSRATAGHGGGGDRGHDEHARRSPRAHRRAPRRRGRRRCRSPPSAPRPTVGGRAGCAREGRSGGGLDAHRPRYKLPTHGNPLERLQAVDTTTRATPASSSACGRGPPPAADRPQLVGRAVAVAAADDLMPVLDGLARARGAMCWWSTAAARLALAGELFGSEAVAAAWRGS